MVMSASLPAQQSDNTRTDHTGGELSTNMRVVHVGQEKLIKLGHGWNPVVRVGYAIRETAGKSLNERVRLILAGICSHKVARLAQATVTSEEELKAALYRTPFDETSTYSTSERLREFVAAAMEVDEQTVDALRILSREAGLSEPEAILIFYEKLKDLVSLKLCGVPLSFSLLEVMVRTKQKGAKKSNNLPDDIEVNAVRREEKWCPACRKDYHSLQECWSKKKRGARSDKRYQAKPHKHAKPNSGNRVNVAEVASYSDSEEDKKKVPEINKKYNYSLVPVTINGVNFDAVPDSGANSVILSLYAVRKAKISFEKNKVLITVTSDIKIAAKGTARNFGISFGELVSRIKGFVLPRSPRRRFLVS